MIPSLALHQNPFGDEEGAGGEDGKSKAEIAAEKKAWLQEPDRDYTYTELLGRFFSLLYSSHPSLSRGGAKKRYTIAPPNVQREGSKRTLFANIEEICKKMHRQPEHVIQFLFAELGTSGSVDGSKRLVIKGRFQQKQIENVLRHYIGELLSVHQGRGLRWLKSSSRSQLNTSLARPANHQRRSSRR